MALQSKLDDKERPIRLMYKTLLFYRQAVLKYAEDARDNRAGKNGYTQDTIRQLKSDLETWCKIAMNAYIPSAEKCNLSHERHVYWEKVFKSMLDK